MGTVTLLAIQKSALGTAVIAAQVPVSMLPLTAGALPVKALTAKTPMPVKTQGVAQVASACAEPLLQAMVCPALAIPAAPHWVIAVMTF